ncbi:bifunctional serine/threonine-protein kinase/formylglycine-generating enzyme family protein [Candidatus Villigracilis affinis]|uniref:bifunctional serine/threonine-protein kinase/formylglycine-generating enzyme family protein n=1 Tax=Candidatus Villigracilis affinis TaxID=3140682 RepID=UPI001DB8D235|nr:SUMF1/EgtB/PvdO family nonheme iron enzyme [Anaerolineales bacterium]
MQNIIGQSLGRYQILEQLGEGGMATVYKAYDTRLDRYVAIKVIRNDLFGPTLLERMLKRFEREAKALAKLSHPNIVKVLDYGEHNGAPYLVLEYLPGGTLKGQVMGKPIPWQEAVRLLLPIAGALDYAHEQKIIHRDVKPANILLTEKGQPMLSDFGIAKILEMKEEFTLTGSGTGIGTPEYMAPEQGMGREVDARTDIYSLGIVLYELVTGRKPYTADTPMAVVLKHMTDPLPRPRQYIADLPDIVERVLLKALAKDPQDRYSKISEFADALENADQSRNIADNQPNAPTSSTNLTQLLQQKNLNRLWLAFGVVGIVFTGVLIGWLARGDKTTEVPPTTTPSSTSIPINTTTPSVTINPTATRTPFPTATPKLDIGSTMTGNDGMTLLYVPAGEFTMGSETGKDEEKPIHTIYLDGFWIDQTEVTNQQYALCVTAGQCTSPIETDSSLRSIYYGNSEFDDYPVIYVNWNMAKTYCEWAGRRLPTEAEWEKAARGMDERTYPWGEDISCNEANYDPKDSCFGDTTIAGNFTSGESPYGVYDMAGNVWEWVSDWYSETYYQDSPLSNPLGPDSGQYRVLRGGSFDSSTSGVRTTNRYRYEPTYTLLSIGFRCASSPP